RLAERARRAVAERVREREPGARHDRDVRSQPLDGDPEEARDDLGPPAVIDAEGVEEREEGGRGGEDGERQRRGAEPLAARQRHGDGPARGEREPESAPREPRERRLPRSRAADRDEEEERPQEDERPPPERREGGRVDEPASQGE